MFYRASVTVPDDRPSDRPSVLPSDDVRTARFADLSARELYALLRLRSDVFVVEQQCVYPDLDGRDTEPGTEHVWIEDPAGIVAYLRVLGEADGVRIGRVCTRADARGTGAATRLLAHCLDRHQDAPIVLDAQAYLVDYYARFGFTPSGPEFVEDGIPHVPMRRPARPRAGQAVERR